MIRTPQEYIDSLNDGRLLYYKGEKIPDATKQPNMRRFINGKSLDWILANHPKYRDLITIEVEGERSMFLWQQPKTAEDLIRRRQIFLALVHMGGGGGMMSADAMAAAGIVAARMDSQLGTNYTDAVEDYRQHLMKNDPCVTGAITDVKGDRRLHPSAQVQHKDFYVRVVDRQKDGIIVRGAKMHISTTIASNEIIVSPCRAHQEIDKDYALVFATPLNVKGITLIASPFEGSADVTEDELIWDWPVSGWKGGGGSGGECMIVFDDVFVPWNRVFMCGEWQFSRDIAWAFGTFHRLLGTCHQTAELMLKAGAAALMAEYNGLEHVSHIRDKLAWLALHAEKCNVMSQAACEHPDIFPDIGLAAPNLVYTNIAKYEFATMAAESTQIMSDICGGLVCDVFTYKDWMNPEERPLIDKYLAGKDGIPTEHRLRAIRLIKDMASHNNDQTRIHAQGPLAAQRMSLYAGADWEKYKAAAKRKAGIPGWEEHPEFKDLEEYPLRFDV